MSRKGCPASGGSHALSGGHPIDEFIQSVYNYPTLADAYKYAAYDGLGEWDRRHRSGKNEP